MIDEVEHEGTQLTPEKVAKLQDLCARHETMPDDDFANELCRILEIHRAMLYQATAIMEAGLREDVDAGRLTFEEAYWLAKRRLSRLDCCALYCKGKT